MARTMRAAIYARISSDRDGDALGVERQLEDCRRVCTQQDWIATEYVDNNLSASKREVARPEYNRMVDDIKAGEVDVVVVWDVDRLTRRQLELEQFVDVCDAAGMTMDIHTVSGPMTLVMVRMKGIFAAEEVRKTAQRGARKNVELAQAGKPHGGRRAFGFEKNGIDHKPVEATLIREAAHRVLEGEALHSIRRDWQERGVLTASGKTKWSVSALKRVLISPRVSGLRQYQGDILEGVKTVWEPIIDRETWEQVCVVLEDPARFTGPRTQNYPLNDILTCGLCFKPLKAMPRQGKRAYGCKKDAGGCNHIHIKADTIEKYVFDHLVPMTDHPEFRDDLRAEEEGTNEARRELVLENAEDEKMLSQFIDDYADRVIGRPEYLEQSQRLRKRIEARGEQLTTLRGTSVLNKLGGSVVASWDSMSAEDKGKVLRSLVDRIEVRRATKPGSNAFDPARLTVCYRSEAIAKLMPRRYQQWKARRA